MSVPIVVGFALTAIIAGVLFSLWWGADTDSRDHDERLTVIEQALNLGGEPQHLVDPPTEPIGIPTEPMPKVDLAGGARRPTPYRRGPRHAA